MMEKSFIDEKFIKISERIEQIKEKCAETCIKSGRNPEEVRLMAVKKTVEPIFINRAIECGIDLIGENKVQEFLGKKDELNLDGVEAHLIGHLQTNKVRQIVGQVDMIQSVDSMKVAAEIDKESKKQGIVTDVLLEVNIGKEENKSGFLYEETEFAAAQIAELGSVNIKGLMAIPPQSENERELFTFFSNMRQLFIDIAGKKMDNINMDILSMGMSGDFEAAVACGSTLVRVGSAIFGERDYTKK